MKKKFNLFIIILFISLFFSNNSEAKPRCEELYESIYNDEVRQDVNFYYNEDKKTIGIRLAKQPDKDKKNWTLATNKDGYFKVGKVTKGELSKLIFLNDIILSINDIDLRKLIKEKENIESFEDEISNYFEKDELIKFKILRLNPKTNQFYEVIVDRTGDSNQPNIFNTLEMYNEPVSDFYINSISVNEKAGNFDATIETDFYQPLDDRYSITKKIRHQNLKIWV